MFKIILTIGTIQAVAVFIQFIKSKIVAIYLGPAGVGVVGTIDQFVQLVAFVSVFGIPAASIKFLSKAHSEGDEVFKRSYAGFFKILLLLSATGAVLTIGIILLKSNILGEELEKYRLFLILGLLTIPTFTLTTLFINVFAAVGKSKASSLLVVITNATLMTAAVTGVIAAGVFGLYIGSVLAGVVLTVAVMIYFRRNLGLPIYDCQTNTRQKFKRNPDIFSIAAMLYLSAITASLSLLAARYSILKNFGEVEAGLLHGLIALSLAFGMALYPAINLYLTPLINRDVEKGIKIHLAVQFQRKIALILSIAALPILMFPRLMLTILFSAEFAGISQLLFLFVMSQFIVQLAGVYQALLVGIDDVKSYTAITTGGQMLSAFMCVLLVPYFGIKGVAFGFLTANSCVFLLTLMRLVITHGFTIPINIVLLFAYTFAVLFLAGFVCSGNAEWDVSIILIKIVFSFLFGGSLWLFLSKEEKVYLSALRDKFFFGK